MINKEPRTKLTSIRLEPSFFIVNIITNIRTKVDGSTFLTVNKNY